MVWSQFSINILRLHFGNSLLDNYNWEKIRHSLTKHSVNLFGMKKKKKKRTVNQIILSKNLSKRKLKKQQLKSPLKVWTRYFRHRYSIKIPEAQRGYLKCSIRGINNQIRNRFYKSVIFNCLTSNVNLFILNCLTSNINLFNFSCLTSNFCFSKNIFFTRRREQIFMDVHPQFWAFSSTRKMMTCYL